MQAWVGLDSPSGPVKSARTTLSQKDHAVSNDSSTRDVGIDGVNRDANSQDSALTPVDRPPQTSCAPVAA
jgi:hypothetical protein